MVYGHNVDAVTVMVDGREFVKAFQKVGRNQLVDLQLGDEPLRKALIREVQRNPRDGDLLHVDFYQVNLTEKIESEVPIELDGTVELVSKGEADLQRGLHALKVECLPTDLPPVITVDISGLKEVDDEIRVKDLAVPPGCEILDEPDDLIVTGPGRRRGAHCRRDRGSRRRRRGGSPDRELAPARPYNGRDVGLDHCPLG